MATTNIDEIFDQIKKDFVMLSEKATRSAATKAQKDIAKKADKFIDEYYASYKPKWYRRKEALYDLVEEYYKETDKKNGVLFQFGVTYEPSKIKGVHKSNSWWHQSGGAWQSMWDSESGGFNSKFNFDSQNNGIPDPYWITKNFLEGYHPWAKQDMQSPDDKMQKFFDKELEKIITSYLNDAMFKELEKYF